MPKGRTATKTPTELSAGTTNNTRVDLFWTIAIATATLATFLLLTANQFVNWDDPYTLIDNKRLASPGIFANA